MTVASESQESITVAQVPVPVTTEPLKKDLFDPRVAFGKDSISLLCPNCKYLIATEVKRTYSIFQNCCFCCLLITFWCSLIACCPYFFCNPKRVQHKCPHCRVILGEWERPPYF